MGLSLRLTRSGSSHLTWAFRTRISSVWLVSFLRVRFSAAKITPFRNSLKMLWLKMSRKWVNRALSCRCYLGSVTWRTRITTTLCSTLSWWSCLIASPVISLRFWPFQTSPFTFAFVLSSRVPELSWRRLFWNQITMQPLWNRMQRQVSLLSTTSMAIICSFKSVSQLFRNNSNSICFLDSRNHRLFFRKLDKKRCNSMWWPIKWFQSTTLPKNSKNL